MSTFDARTVSVTLTVEPRRVYTFVRDGSKLPTWVGFCKSMRAHEGGWIMETEQATMFLRYVEDNAFGVLDHHVRTDAADPRSEQVYVPMRVVANGSGSELTLTVFRGAGMSDEAYAQDVAMVERDLASLKRLLESP